MTRFIARAAGLAAGLALLAAAPAVADTAVISFTDAAGNDDPVSYVGRTLTVKGNAQRPGSRVYIKHRAPGGAPCAPSAASDSGDALGYEDFHDFYGRGNFNGDFSTSKTGTWDAAPGTVVFCIWLTPDGSTATTTPITQTITFRGANGTVSASVNPATAAEGQPVDVTITGSSEASADVYAKYRPVGGAPCAPTYTADQGRSLVYDHDVNGAFSLSRRLDKLDAGTYVVCTWLTRDSDAPAIAGPQPTTFTVVAPCVVPAIAPGTDQAAAVAALGAARCAAGPTTYVASRRYAAGTVVALGTAAGTKLPTGAPVAMVISSGRPCDVPSARRGMSVSAARTRLSANGCDPGRVVRVRSSRRRGTVVRFGPRGRGLAPDTTVTIYVSKGRRR